MNQTTPTKPIHGTPKPVDVPKDMQDFPPMPCDFKTGDVVDYTNDNGLTARARVRGFAREPQITGGFIYLEHWSAAGWRVGAWWFAHRPECLRRPKKHTTAATPEKP